MPLLKSRGGICRQGWLSLNMGKFTCDKNPIEEGIEAYSRKGENEDIRANIHSHWRAHPLLKRIDSIDPQD
jgi:hypothetical protein